MRDDIINVVTRLFEAENSADADAARRLLSKDFIAITRARGVEQEREALLDELAHPKNPSVTRTLEGIPSAWQTGDLAFVRSIVSIQDGEPPIAVRFRNLHILRREGDAWACLAWQVTKLV